MNLKLIWTNAKAKKETHIVKSHKATHNPKLGKECVRVNARTQKKKHESTTAVW